MKKVNFALLMMLIAALLLAGCDGKSYTRTNWTQTSLPGITKATFGSFTGIDSTKFQADEGELLTMQITYAVEGGNLGFILMSPDGELLWESQELGESDTLSFSLELPETGTYKIQYLGMKAKGNFEITWEIDETADQSQSS